MIKVWRVQQVGRALNCRSIAGTPDLTLVAAVSRKHAGRGLGEVLRAAPKVFGLRFSRGGARQSLRRFRRIHQTG